MRPFRTFLLLLILLISFAGLSYVLPWDLNLPTLNTLLPDKITELFEVHDESLLSHDTTGITLQDAKEIVPPDNFVSASASDSAVIIADTISPGPGLPDKIRVFIDSMKYSADQVRIMYYGDSQIEGDRVTSYLRHYLRLVRKGTGPGLFLPVMPVSYTKSFYVRASTNWHRYNYLSYRNGEISHNELGPFMAFCRYSPENYISNSKIKSWVRITRSVFADNDASDFEYLRILYKTEKSGIEVMVKADNYPMISDSLRKCDEISEFRCPLYGSENILIEFSGYSSPDIYGISIESRNGLIIDNIPQRGSAGLEFTMVDKENLRQAMKLLAPDLIFMQYGLNLATNIRNDYDYYARGLIMQISLIKEISPRTEVVVVGLTDMAFQEGDRVLPYPNIQKIINAQKYASDITGSVFWDARTAMGGPSSIIRWFGADPPLAKKDYVHFTDQGADTLAKLLLTGLFSLRQFPHTDTSFVSPPESPDTDSLTISEIPVSFDKDSDDRNFIRVLLSSAFSYDKTKPFIFTTPAFWMFFLLVMAGFLVVHKKLYLRNLYLFIISLFFYYKTGGFFLILLIIVTLIDFSSGLLMNRSVSRAGRKAALLLSIISNIGLLAYFKYTGFFIDTFNNLFGTGLIARDYLMEFSNDLFGTHFDTLSIILPVGISFFTFQSLSYTIDVYRRKLEPVRNIIDFGFYVSFFPQLVAGPIVRASEFIPQLYTPYNVTKREFSYSIFLIMKGLIKKIIISDFIAVNFIDRVFDLPTAHSGLENLMAVYGYGLQIYCDFSGYTDIAIGIGLLLGFRLPVNFNSPYKAANMSDFWGRWHISLSRWLKDYLYIPLGGNKKGRVRTILNLMLTMLLGGLWHGANLRFIIWGGLHGIALAINKIWVYIFGDRTVKGRLMKAISVFMTFQFVNFCWIFFRADDTREALLVMRQIAFKFMPGSLNSVMSAYGEVFALIAAGFLIHFLPERVRESYRGIFIRIPIPVQMILVLLTGFLLYQMNSSEVVPFIYFRF